MEQSDISSIIKCIDLSIEVIDSADKCYSELQPCDPFKGIGDEPQPPYYRVDSIVFADPLENETLAPNCEDSSKNVPSDSTIVLNDNVMVRKRKGRGKNLYVHLEDESKLNCPVENCTKSFATPTLLSAHIRKVHFSERQHTCEVCGASFTASYLLKRHSLVHGAERVQCPVCNKILSLRTK
ncbi:zinc finger protein 728-like [Ostrinia nubilalis]|uniref:zinc finger protein 728-like n=1 Tax=Ostrinia nubilalis TaxID=29057 RepID=UPI003082656B